MFGLFRKRNCDKTRDMLSAYLDGYLEPGDVAWLEGHLEGCPTCREELDSLKATVALLQGLPQVQPRRSFLVPPRPVPAPVPVWGWRALRASTAAAAVLLMALVAGDMLGLVAVGPAARPEASVSLDQMGLRGPAGPAGAEAPLPTPPPLPARAETSIMAPQETATPAPIAKEMAPTLPETSQPVRIPAPWPGWQLEAGLAGAWLILAALTLYRWHARRRGG